jgi:HprK-related kinase A
VRVADLTLDEVAARLAGRGLALDLGSARVRVRGKQRAFAAAIRQVYGEFPDEASEGFFEVSASVERAAGLRRWLRPQVRFVANGESPFEPFPADTHLPLWEWGLNWCLANDSNQYLLLHAGVVERDGRAVVLPAQPGSGKSTLAAALECSGYRLLSDEFGVVDLERGVLLPLVRPVALKNESIDVIRAFAPDAVIGPSFARTRKGTVAHLAPTRASVAQRHAAATPALILFPKYAAGEAVSIEEVPPARAFAKLAGNAFNYELLGPAAFDAVERLVRATRSYRLRYSDLAAGVAALSQLLGN